MRNDAKVRAEDGALVVTSVAPSLGRSLAALDGSSELTEAPCS